MPGLFVLHDDLPPGDKVLGLVRLIHEYDIEFNGPLAFVQGRRRFRR